MIYRHKLYCHLLGLDKASSVAYNSGETQTCNYFVLPFGRDGLWRNPRKRLWQEEGSFEVLKRFYIQIYPTGFSLSYGKAVNLRSTYVKLGVE